MLFVKISLLLFIILYLPFALAQSNKEITFIVTSDTVPDSLSIFITGNHSVFGNWYPDAAKLEENTKNEWIGSFSLPEGYKFEYKFTLGSWEREAINEYGMIPGNSKLAITNDTLIYVEIPSWRDNSYAVFEGQITGTVKYHPKMKGKGIKERDIVVWLPPGYDENTEEYYPVLYMHDGQNMFDPKTSAIGIDWQIDEAADTLIRNGYIKPIIIVGIHNTPHRSSEYSHNDTGYAYMDFVVNELKPLIDSIYRTLPARENTATGGSSLGGLISFMLVWEKSDVFSQAVCISPALKISRYNFVTPVENYTGDKKDIRVYIDNGGIGVEDSLQAGIDEMLTALKKQGYSQDEDLYWIKDVDAEHGESDWAKRIWHPLIFMFGKEGSYSYIKQ
jgi:predicted alpha/beta superfamily hydrolase